MSRSEIIIITILILYSVLLFLVYKKLKDKAHELENFDKLRKSFINADNSIIYLKDENLRYVFANKTLETFYKKKSSQIIGKDDFELIDKEFSEKQKKTDTEVLEKLTNIKSEMTWQERKYITNKFPVQLINGKYGVGAYIEDVTEVNNKLKDHKDKLQLILDSTAEAIYGMDNEGICTFCNASCIKMLGYENYDDLLGKNMHLQIHHSYKDGTPMPIEDCNIVRALLIGKGTHVTDEVFWTAEGKSFDVEYRSYPQFKDGEVIGAVVTFMDITERKRLDEEIKYLTYHDGLTGLFNRTFFDVERIRLDTERNLPISIIMGDANSLKLTNDIFGHAVGDKLLVKVADAFRKVCREDDIIARIGGDEFIILLPNTEAEDAEKIISRINNEISKEQILAIKPSISMGSSTKITSNQDLIKIIEDAEIKMYQDKSINRKNINSKNIKTITESLHGKYPIEKEHSKNVSFLSQEIGSAMNLTKEEVRRLKDAGFLHNIGKIAFSDEKDHKQHSLVGYRILNSFDDTFDIAEPVLSHHENWDGSGFPNGLMGNDINLLSRILAVAEYYDSLTNKYSEPVMSKEEAILEIKKQSGIKLDPNIVDILVGISEGL